MQIFISWSGERSQRIADAIRNWLPMVVQSVKPWMSQNDIAAGARWLTDIAESLNSAKVGIICVTPENQHNPWLLFEAGALSKTLEQPCVCPLVFEMTPGQLDGPLTQFQANPLNREGIGKVVATINNGLAERQIEPHQLEHIVDVWWPQLEERLQQLPAPAEQAANRPMGDQIEELLSLARENMRRENLRLEGSRERDEKVDQMIGFMEKSFAAMAMAQHQMKKMVPHVAKDMERRLAMIGKTAGAPKGMFTPDLSTLAMNAEELAATAASIDIGAMENITRNIREMSDRDKERTKSMLDANCGENDGN